MVTELPASSWAGRVAAMAVIAAVGISVIYLPQPIQTLVSRELGVPAAQSAAAAIAVQAGYAVGVILLVPLGDRIAARRQVTIQLVITAAAIVVAATASSYALFTAMFFVAGAAATVGQVLVSAALRLAPPAVRARTAAVLLGAFIVGLFAVRTLLGSLAESLGWRTVLLGCAALLLLCVPLSLAFAPRERPVSPPAYLRVLASIPRVFAGSSTLRLLTATHALGFAAFISVWSVITVFGVNELGLSVGQVSLLGIAGLVGGVLTIGSAPVQSVVGPRRALPLSQLALLTGTVLLAAFPHVVPVDLAGLLLVAFGMSSAQVTTQAKALASVDAAESGRANSIFMATTFLGGALATAAADALFRNVGFTAVALMATGFALLSLLLGVVARRLGIL